MSRVEDFLSVEEEQEIVTAIRKAERNTSGEIRVHIERTSDKKHYERTLEVFHMLKMFNTKEQNAVLIYVAVDDHKFVVYGDKGINEMVDDNFWDITKEVIQDHFKIGDFKQGIIEGVLRTGEELKVYFPWSIKDEDELSNEISTS